MRWPADFVLLARPQCRWSAQSMHSSPPLCGLDLPMTLERFASVATWVFPQTEPQREPPLQA